MMEPFDRPRGMNDAAAAVFDMLFAIACDAEISMALIEGDIMHPWVNASLFKALQSSGLDIGVELVEVRTCNYPLHQYDQDLNIPDVNYSCRLFLRAGGWLFDSDSAATPSVQSKFGFASFPNEEAAVICEISRRQNQGAKWHHEVKPTRGASFTGSTAPAMVDRAIAEALARHRARQMQSQTPSSPPVPSPRF